MLTSSISLRSDGYGTALMFTEPFKDGLRSGWRGDQRHHRGRSGLPLLHPYGEKRFCLRVKCNALNTTRKVPASGLDGGSNPLFHQVLAPVEANDIIGGHGEEFTGLLPEPHPIDPRWKHRLHPGRRNTLASSDHAGVTNLTDGVFLPGLSMNGVDAQQQSDGGHQAKQRTHNPVLIINGSGVPSGKAKPRQQGERIGPSYQAQKRRAGRGRTLVTN